MKTSLKNDKDAIVKCLSDMYSLISNGDWCICITLFNGSEYCGKLLKQNDTANPYKVIIVLLDGNGQEIHIDLADVKLIKKCIK
jgi:hypothetical protein